MKHELESSHQRIELLVTSRGFHQPALQQFLMSHTQVMRFRDATQLPLLEGELWIFDYGVIVCWGISENDKQKWLNLLQPYMDAPKTPRPGEEYQYRVDASANLRIHNDQMTLPEENLMLRLAVSHAFAQSTKLGVFEEKAVTVIDEHRDLARTLARTGRIPLSRRQLSKLRGTLFEARSDILLHFNLLDTPEFFWDYPELEPAYLTVAKYLDLVPRIELLSRKLETIHELVDMLASEQNHKHSSFLEWIIIALIAVEIVMNLPGHFG